MDIGNLYHEICWASAAHSSSDDSPRQQMHSLHLCHLQSERLRLKNNSEFVFLRSHVFHMKQECAWITMDWRHHAALGKHFF